MDEFNASEISDAASLVNQFKIAWPKVVEALSQIQGKNLYSSAEFPEQELLSKFELMVPLLRELESLSTVPDSVEKFHKMLTIMDRLMVLTIPESQGHGGAISYLLSRLRQATVGTIGSMLPEGCDYESRRDAVNKSISDLYWSDLGPQTSNFIDSTPIAEGHLIPQLQKFTEDGLLPLDLSEAPKHSDRATAQKLLRLVGEIAADWEQFLGYPYGLTQIKEGKTPQWNKIIAGVLRTKVEAVSKNVDLRLLASLDWVTMRNSVSHGTARYDPVDDVIIFTSKNNSLRLTANEVYVECVNMYLSNLAMACIPSVNTIVQLSIYERFVQSPRDIAQDVFKEFTT